MLFPLIYIQFTYKTSVWGVGFIARFLIHFQVYQFLGFLFINDEDERDFHVIFAGVDFHEIGAAAVAAVHRLQRESERSEMFYIKI